MTYADLERRIPQEGSNDTVEGWRAEVRSLIYILRRLRAFGLDKEWEARTINSIKETWCQYRTAMTRVMT